MKKVHQFGFAILFVITLIACSPSRVMYAPAKITVQGGRVHIQPKDKFRPMPDTTIDAVIIRRQR